MTLLRQGKCSNNCPWPKLYFKQVNGGLAGGHEKGEECLYYCGKVSIV